MQINQTREPCQHEGCSCTVPQGEEYCGDACRKAASESTPSDAPADCACGHDACAQG